MAGQGYTNTPGLHTAQQVDAWRKVTDAVHAQGGTIFAQLMHTGRISHPSLLPDGLIPVAPSAIAATGQVFTYQGPQDYVTPKELDQDDITRTIADYADAARNAIAAGFDGVEIHGANGYLIHQFLDLAAGHGNDHCRGRHDHRLARLLRSGRNQAAARRDQALDIPRSPVG